MAKKIGDLERSGRIAYDRCPECGGVKGISRKLCRPCDNERRLASQSEAREGLGRPLTKRLNRARSKARYQLFSVTGFEIRPRESGRPGGNSRPATTWAVLDQWNCWREVGVFHPGNGVSSEGCRQRAAELARELNALEKEELASGG